jgi:hypothetical protein
MSYNTLCVAPLQGWKNCQTRQYFISLSGPEKVDTFIFYFLLPVQYFLLLHYPFASVS